MNNNSFSHTSVFVEKGGDQYGELLILTVDGRARRGDGINDLRRIN